MGTNNNGSLTSVRTRRRSAGCCSAAPNMHCQRRRALTWMFCATIAATVLLAATTTSAASAASPVVMSHNNQEDSAASDAPCGCRHDISSDECVHVLLATPCYSASVTDSYLLSVSRTFQYFSCSPVQIHLATVPGIADLPKARGGLIYKFLSEPHYRYIFFIDADVEWAPAMMDRFIASGHDFISAMYPKKQLDWGRLRDTVLSSSMTLEELKSAVLDYPVEWEFEDGRPETTGQVQTDNAGFARVRRAGAAFLMVSRAAMERMVAGYPELAYVDPPSGQTHYGLFYNGFQGSTGDKRWISEDFAFCDRWRGVGGEIWVDLTTGLNHTGTFRFEGGHWIKRFQQQPSASGPSREETPSASQQQQQQRKQDGEL